MYAEDDDMPKIDESRSYAELLEEMKAHLMEFSLLSDYLVHLVRQEKKASDVSESFKAY